MRVIWTQEALGRLSDIENLISKDSTQRVMKFVNYLIERGESVSENVRIGRVVPEISNPDIREIIAKKYRIVYRIKEKTIEILTVFEGHKLLNLEEFNPK